ncbi:hypothetical protein, partial [Microbacterium sp.]|uniref:hypothetical protein n=1 Tax=Microbacterium sp. TaxID=51671 RepID=UPI002E2F4F45
MALSLFAVTKYANDTHRRISGREMRRVRPRPVIDRLLRIVIALTAGERELTALLHDEQNRASARRTCAHTTLSCSAMPDRYVLAFT